MASVSELAKAGQRIQAVAMHREVTGASLLTSKDAVDDMVAHHGRP